MKADIRLDRHEAAGAVADVGVLRDSFNHTQWGQLVHDPAMQPFVEGFLTDEKADPPMWGRPVDLLVMKDGSMLFSDDYNGIIYRVSHGK